MSNYLCSPFGIPLQSPSTFGRSSFESGSETTIEREHISILVGEYICRGMLAMPVENPSGDISWTLRHHGASRGSSLSLVLLPRYLRSGQRGVGSRERVSSRCSVSTTLPPPVTGGHWRGIISGKPEYLVYLIPLQTDGCRTSTFYSSTDVRWCLRKTGFVLLFS